MSLIEFIGFLISFAAMIFLLGKGVWDNRARRQNPEEYYRKVRTKEQNLKKFLKSLDVHTEDEDEDEDEIDEKEEAKAPAAKQAVPPSPFQKPYQQRLLAEDQYHFQDRLDHYQTQTAIDQRKLKIAIENRFKGDLSMNIVSADLREMNDYHAIVSEKPSRANRLINRRSSRQEMILYQEILNPPLALTGVWTNFGRRPSPQFVQKKSCSEGDGCGETLSK
jgi:hypothetical protein